MIIKIALQGKEFPGNTFPKKIQFKVLKKENAWFRICKSITNR